MAVTTVTTTMAGAINYTVVTDTSADWPSVANSTYFYDKADKLVHYKNSAGVVLEIFGVSGLTYFTEAQSTAAPNATVNVDSLTAVASTADADIAIVPKGNGAFMLDVPDNTAAGGNKRGAGAIDLQVSRAFNTSVASGSNSIVIGYDSRASASGAVAIGSSARADGINAVAIGPGAQATNNECYVLGNGSVASGAFGATALGRGNVSSGDGTLSAGFNNTASGSRAVALGESNIASQNGSVALGKGSTASGGQATALGTLNTASGSASVAAGYGNTGAGFGSIAIGVSNTTGYDYQFAIGNGNALSNAGPSGLVQNTFAFGTGNTVNANNAVAIGSYGLINGVTSRQTFSPSRIATNGDSQKSTFFYRGRTTDATLTTIATDGSNSINAANCMQLANNNAIGFTGTIVGKQSGSTNAAMWKVEGLIVRGASAAATTLVTSTVTLVSNAPAWGTPVLSAYIDAFNGVGALRVQIQGAAATNIQWTGIIETTEVIYA